MKIAFSIWQTGTPDNTATQEIDEGERPQFYPNGLGQLKLRMATQSRTDEPTTLQIYFMSTERPMAHLLDEEGTTDTTKFVGIPDSWTENLSVTVLFDYPSGLFVPSMARMSPPPPSGRITNESLITAPSSWSSNSNIQMTTMMINEKKRRPQKPPFLHLHQTFFTQKMVR